MTISTSSGRSARTAKALRNLLSATQTCTVEPGEFQPGGTVQGWGVSSPAVTQKSLQDVRGAWRAENAPLYCALSHVGAADLLWAEPFFDPMLDAVVCREADGLGAGGEAVVHKRHGVLEEGGLRE